MNYLTNLGLEVLSEVIGILIIGCYFLWEKRKYQKNITKLTKDLSLERLNNNKVDEVLLIDNMDYLSTNEGMKKFNKASVVLLKDETKMYDIVIKNDYGKAGTINN